MDEILVLLWIPVSIPLESLAGRSPSIIVADWNAAYFGEYMILINCNPLAFKKVSLTVIQNDVVFVSGCSSDDLTKR